MSAKLFTGQRPAVIDLGVYRGPRGERSLELVVSSAMLQDLARRAVTSKAGRAEAARGGVVVRIKRPVAAEGARGS